MPSPIFTRLNNPVPLGLLMLPAYVPPTPVLPTVSVTPLLPGLLITTAVLEIEFRPLTVCAVALRNCSCPLPSRTTFPLVAPLGMALLTSTRRIPPGAMVVSPLYVLGLGLVPAA